MSDEKQKLYEKQKAMLDQFLKTGAIDKAQYEKSLNGLKEKMRELAKNHIGDSNCE